MKNQKLVECGICLNVHSGVMCSVCGAIHVNGENINRLSGLVMVRAIPMPVRVRTSSADYCEVSNGKA